MNPSEQSLRSNSGQNGVNVGPRRPTSSVGITNHLISDNDNSGLGQRSISLSTLQPTIIEPRMAQLETLEAKMASIEVSLSSTPRRKKNVSLSGISLGSSIRSIPKELALKELESLRNALRDKENIIQSLKGQLTVPGLKLNAMRNCNSNGSVRELTEVEKKQAEDRLNRLKTDIDNKRLAIKNLKLALERLDITDNIDVRIQQAELEYQLGREELNLLSLLEETRTLQLCIEESNKMTIETHTLYSCVEGNDHIILQAIEVDYDPKSPKFGAGQKDSKPGLFIDWALEETHLRKDDRLIEVNGKIVLNKSRDDLMRLLAAAPDPAQLVVLRKPSQNGEIIISSKSSKELLALRSELEQTKEKAEEVQRMKETLRTDNIRLTHRISYLEEQVSELLSKKSADPEIRIVTPTPVISKSNRNVTNINITSQSPVSTNSTNSDAQVYQKGTQVSSVLPNNCLEAKEAVGYPIRSKSSLSNVSNTHISSSNSDYHCQKGPHKHKHRSARNGVQSPIGSPINDKITYRKHHHHHREKDYNSETNSGTEHMAMYNKRNHESHRYPVDFAKANSEKEYTNDIMDQSYKKATKIVHELTRNRDKALYEKHRQKCITASEKYNVDILRHYNARKSTSVIDFRSEIHIGPKYDSKSIEKLDSVEPSMVNDRVYKKIQDVRSVKSLDFDSDCNSTRASSRANGRTDYTSEPSTDKQIYSNGYDNVKTRPTPPKKPARLSLHKTHSLQSVDNNCDIQSKMERKCMKRNYKGEIPIFNYKAIEQNGDPKEHLKWHYRKSMESNLENGSWC